MAENKKEGKRAGEKITAETTVNATELAALFGCTARRIQQLAQDSVFVSVSRGKYNLKEAIEAWMDYQRGDQSADEEAEKARKARAEAKLKEAKADIEEIRAKELKGDMHRGEDVAQITEDMIYSIRSALIAFPGRVAVDVHECGTAAEVSGLLTKEVHKIMRELAGYHYDPARYEEKVREREKWAMMNEEAEDE